MRSFYKFLHLSFTMEFTLKDHFKLSKDTLYGLLVGSGEGIINGVSYIFMASTARRELEDTERELFDILKQELNKTPILEHIPYNDNFRAAYNTTKLITGALTPFVTVLGYVALNFPSETEIGASDLPPFLLLGLTNLINWKYEHTRKKRLEEEIQ